MSDVTAPRPSAGSADRPDAAAATTSSPSGEMAASAGRGRRAMRLLALMGPAFIVGAWQFGPGNLTSAVQAGSRFGYSLIWVIAVSTVLMLVYADMSIRIALVSRGSVVETIKEQLGRWSGRIAGFGVFAITLMFSVGNAVGSGLGLSLVFGGSPTWWTPTCTAVVVAILFARRLYTVIEKLVLVLVAIMAVSFVATAIVTRPDWGAAATGSVVPVVPAGVGLLIVALVGTNFSINAAFYAGYASRERGLRREQYRQTTLVDTIPGIVAPGIMTALVITAAAAVLPGAGGEEGASLKQFSAVLTPIAGEAGQTVFSLGFTGAAISAMIANATAGGTLLSDGLGYGNRLSSWKVRGGILGVLGFGALVTVLAHGASPIQLIIAAQALTVVVVPILALLMLILANRSALMGDLRNTWWQNVLSAIGLIAIAAVCYQLIVTAFF
ncbi:NRAMP (natural resistance-associated macrophage protein)-like metal ion transporter [Saccharopolyspora erythraea NRRL 2338]|nr:NRAMP (natural resistance-associated macrophage protein)-like metal ion transporter [Saccharopolyspora erythraea NRRL 2338]